MTNWHWDREQKNAFHTLKRSLSETAHLRILNSACKKILKINASNITVSACLYQIENKQQRLIVYQFKKLSEPEKRYEVHDKVTEEARACLKLNKLIKDVWTTINSVSKQLVWKTKSHKIKICLLTEYSTSGDDQWTFSEDYMSPEFLSKVKALQNQIQWEYDQYKSHLHSEQYIEKGSKKYIQLIIQEIEPKWFQNLKRKASNAVQSKNCKLSQRD